MIASAIGLNFLAEDNFPGLSYIIIAYYVFVKVRCDNNS